MAFITRFTSTCCKSTWSPLTTDGSGERLTAVSTSLALMSWRDQGQALLDHVAKVGRLFVQLMASEHGPLTIDDLRGVLALGPYLR